MPLHILVASHQAQPLMDTLQRALGGDEGHRILLLAALATLLEFDEAKNSETKKAESTTREELYDQVVRGARIDSRFLPLVFLSTVVAGIGLIDDNVAVIVGAMVIAPL